MKNIIKHRRASIANLAAGYIISVSFIILILLNRPEGEHVQPTIVVNAIDPVEQNVTNISHEIAHDTVKFIPRREYVDHLDGIIIDDHGEIVTAVVRDDGLHTVRNINIDDEVRVLDRDIVSRDHHTESVDRVLRNGQITNDRDYAGRRDRGHRVDVARDDTVTYVDDMIDTGLLDRRLMEIEEHESIGLDVKDGVDVGRLTVARDTDDAELGDVGQFPDDSISTNGGYGVGKGGQLYAYNFPSQGVGAGVGTSGLGAGGGAGAGLSAGVGQGVSSGETVPTLGGVGTYMDSTGATGQGSGVGGLVSGAGAGGAAGLYTGQAIASLGSGPGVGPGGVGNGGYNYDNLPKNGALHIMMHVDGSGSILNTRKQLDLMKDTLLKTALLPYYNNDESLYNRRVTIVSSSGERTLQFFTEAAKKENVLAIAFQDEAQPAYHLPNFNKKPEDHYLDDIKKLKASLDGFNGVYRGVMFQVDRGNTFAKSFKEFVENAWRGEGYLESNNLKKYYRDNNTQHIRNRDGVVFSDEYHAKDSGDPQYYLNLIMNAAKKVGLDLKTNSGGLTDGKHIY